MSESNAQRAPVTITANAARRIAALIAAEARPGTRLRVSVSGGGCSGFQYHFALDDQGLPDDIAIDSQGAAVSLDSMSLMYVLGSELDYVEDLTGSYFRVNNPNASSSCGCGTSFAI